ncbi:MAG: hypothetical protein WB797_05560 [Nocardioides sp.]
MSTAAPTRRPTIPLRGGVLRRDALPSRTVAVALVAASSYGLAAAHPYRGVSDATVMGAKAQDVCSLLVAVALMLLAVRTGPRAHLVRLGLFAYVSYSYSIFMWGLPMNRAFLGYVVLVSVAGGALLDGLVRLQPAAWPRAASRRLERGTGWFLIAVGVLFAVLWLSTLVPFALGGQRPDPEGPGGAPYPVFALDLSVVLPCLVALGALLVRGRRIGTPLAVVALVKIITLFSVLWAGVVAGVLGGSEVELGPDAVPSLLLVLVCCWLLARWARVVDGADDGAVRATFWPATPD